MFGHFLCKAPFVLEGVYGPLNAGSGGWCLRWSATASRAVHRQVGVVLPAECFGAPAPRASSNTIVTIALPNLNALTVSLDLVVFPRVIRHQGNGSG